MKSLRQRRRLLAHFRRQTADAPQDRALLPLAERLAADVSLWLDLLERCPDTWLAGDPLPEAATRADVDAVVGAVEAVVLWLYADLVADTPEHRVAIRAHVAFNDAICRQWLERGISRGAAEQLLAAMLLNLLDPLE